MNTSTTPVQPDYRPDIDGLRAIAVLAVIFFHINKHLIPGGFVGVDVFFVISGYLISLHILRDVALGQFSLVEFYRRRVKRIALPLILVVLATVVAAQLLMLGDDAKKVAESALYSLFSLANVYFWLFQDSSYFAADSNQLPLLHLWSIGIEEQFYILWPLLLLLGYRFLRTKAFFIIAMLATLASFVFAQTWFQYDPSFVYYMLPSRAGELSIGALVAVIVLRGGERKIPLNAITPMASGGFVLLAGSIFLMNEEQVFPGMLALLPTLGAALLILAGHCAKNRISSLLESKPLVMVGLLSYSAYLWHWPLLAFYRYGHGEPGVTAAAVIVGLTFVLAWLSYLLIERPARASQAPALKVIAMQYLLPAYLVACVGLAVIYFNGFDLHWNTSRANAQVAASEDALTKSAPRATASASERSYEEKDGRVVAADVSVDPRLTAHFEKPKPAYLFDYVCQRERVSSADMSSAKCVVGNDSGGEPQVILWGDSNAAHYIGVVGAIAREAGFHFRNIEIDSCPPLAGDPEPFVFAKRLADCRASTEHVLPVVKAAAVIVIAASWSDYAGRSDQFFGQFFATVNALTDAGKFVIIMSKAPEISGYEWDCVEKARASSATAACPFVSAPKRYIQEANAKLKAFAEHSRNVAYFDATPYLCKNGVCSAFDADGSPVYFDAAHLSMPGSWKLGEEILRKEGVPAPFAQIANRLRGAEPAN